MCVAQLPWNTWGSRWRAVLPQQLHLLLEKILSKEKLANGADDKGTPFSILDASPYVLTLCQSL